MKSFFLFATIFLFATSEVQAATFNYIFNNTEQGENSTASPSIVVDGDKITKKNGELVSTTSAPSAPTNAEIESAHNLKYRIMAMGNVMHHNSDQNITFRFTSRDFESLGRKSNSHINASLGASIFTGRDMALSAFLIGGKTEKAHYGAEAEFIPLRIAVLGKSDFIETGLLLGASTIGRENLEKAGTFHAGARVNVNFLPQLGITGAARTNLNERSKYRYAMAEAGLAYRF